jgi:hypothetical protein
MTAIWSLPAIMTGKQRLILPVLYLKERLIFPAANYYPIDSITHVNFMTGKLSAQ